MDDSSEVMSFEQMAFEDQDLMCPPTPRLIPIDKSEPFKLIPAKFKSSVNNGIDNIHVLNKLAGILAENNPSNVPNASFEPNFTGKYHINSRVAKPGLSPYRSN